MRMTKRKRKRRDGRSFGDFTFPGAQPGDCPRALGLGVDAEKILKQLLQLTNRLEFFLPVLHVLVSCPELKCLLLNRGSQLEKEREERNEK